MISRMFKPSDGMIRLQHCQAFIRDPTANSFRF